MECAGNGRVAIEPHVTSQPWVLEAVGTGEWTGTPLRGVLERRRGSSDDAVELVFEGLDAGLEGGDRQATRAASRSSRPVCWRLACHESKTMSEDVTETLIGSVAVVVVLERGNDLCCCAEKMLKRSNRQKQGL